MSKMIVGVFESVDYAESAARQVKEQGLKTDDISIVVKQGEETRTEEYTVTNKLEGVKTNDNISGGVVTGSIVGGLAGLLIGAGMVAIPGLGIIAAAGPIAGLIGGTATGGIVGGMVDLGIPEDEGRQYEEDVRSGKIVFTMKTDEKKIDAISSILHKNGATSVKSY